MDKIRALIVDDSSVMRKIVERSLRQAGIELEQVVEAANGAEALAALQSNVVDLNRQRCGYCHSRQSLDGDSHCPSRAPGSGPSRSRNKDGKTVPGRRPQAHGREVRSPSSTAVVPSRVHLRWGSQNTARFPRTQSCDRA